MAIFDVWKEGFACTGQIATAELVGRMEADSFKAAVQKLYDELTPAARSDWDLERMTIWGCRLFDNEADARRGFG